MLIVTDTETGRTGHLEQNPGYLAGGTYINPSWRIVWDRVDLPKRPRKKKSKAKPAPYPV